MSAKNLSKTLLLTSLAFLATNFIWGVASPVIKYTLSYIPPFTFLFLRFLIVCIVLLPYTIVKLLGTKIPIKDYLNFFLLGIFSQTSIIIIFIALKYTTAIDTTVIAIIGGVLTMYAGHYFYNEKVNKKIKLGAILVCLGTLVVVAEPVLSGIRNHVSIFDRLIGNVLALIYNLTWVTYVIWSKMSMGENSGLLKKTLSFIHIKPMSKKYSPSLIVAISMYVGLLSMVPLALLESSGFLGQVNFDLLSLDTRGIAGLLYMAIFSSIAAYFLNQWALENGRVSEAAIFGYLGPVFAFPTAYFLLGETPTKFLLVGATIITAGVIIAESGGRRK